METQRQEHSDPTGAVVPVFRIPWRARGPFRVQVSFGAAVGPQR